MLEIKNVTKVFNVGSELADQKVALDNVSIKIEDGDFITIIGGNGSGKTTLMNIIAGAFEPDSGHVSINGVNVTHLKEHERSKYVGRVFQDPRKGTATSMSLIENLEIAYLRGQKRGLKWGFKKNHLGLFKEKLSSLDLGLENRLDTKMGVFSGGQRQAVTLLMAALQVPDVLLLDEHTAALDPKTAKIVLDLTEKIVSENKLTTLMITHNMKDAITYGNRLIMLNQGHIVLDIKGKDKKQLTIEKLLKYFENMNNIELDSKLLF